MDKHIFLEMDISLRADYVFQKGQFIGHREYGLKFAIYKCDQFYAEVVINDKGKIQDVIVADEKYLKSIGKIT